VLVGGMHAWPDWSAWPTLTRVWRLSVLIGGAGLAYVVTLIACGFRMRDLRSR
jgi:putative peptidoglycan lipid II flippase